MQNYYEHACRPCLHLHGTTQRVSKPATVDGWMDACMYDVSSGQLIMHRAECDDIVTGAHHLIKQRPCSVITTNMHAWPSFPLHSVVVNAWAMSPRTGLYCESSGLQILELHANMPRASAPNNHRNLIRKPAVEAVHGMSRPTTGTRALRTCPAIKLVHEIMFLEHL